MKLSKRHIQEEWRDSDGYWIALKHGLKSDADPLAAMHEIHEDTKREAYNHNVFKCNCKDCSTRAE